MRDIDNHLYRHSQHIFMTTIWLIWDDGDFLLIEYSMSSVHSPLEKDQKSHLPCSHDPFTWQTPWPPRHPSSIEYLKLNPKPQT